MGVGMQRTVRRGKSRGQAIVELALILPLFLLLTLGIVDMARLFTAYISLTNGVSSAALYAAQDGGYGKWCSDGSLIHCPDGQPLPRIANPNNIAYQIQVETSGLDPAKIDMLAPACTLTVGGTTGSCQRLPIGTYTKVKIVASYNVTMLTPLLSFFVAPTGVRLTAATTAATY
jgi:hypothetical protein